MNAAEIVPADTRYVPLQQQPYLCCPTSLQIVMLRHHIPLIPAELLGHHLGLVVREEDSGHFYNARTAAAEPEDGYGTHVNSARGDVNTVFEKLSIPLRMEIIKAADIGTAQDFADKIAAALDAELDVLLCIRWRDVIDEDTSVEPVDLHVGHIVIVDRMEGETIRLIDCARGKKWKTYKTDYLFNAMKAHEGKPAAGIWIITKKEIV